MANKAPSRLERDVPDASSVEFALTTVGSLSFLFWFVTLGRVNIGPGDIVVGTAGLLYILRTNRFSFGPDTKTALGLVFFLVVSGASVVWSPLRFEALKHYLQLLLIFVVVVPSLFVVYNRPKRRWILTLALVAMFSVIIGGIIVDLLRTNPKLGRYGYVWGKHNTYSWALTSGAIISAFLTRERNLHLGPRIIAALIAVAAGALAARSMTLTALIGLAVGGWLLGYSVVRRRDSGQLSSRYIMMTILGVAIAGVLVATNFSTIYAEGSLRSRIPMYIEAAEEGLARFPLGYGLGSSPVALSDLPAYIPRSTHNFVLHYWLTTGIGVVGFMLVLITWGSKVLIPAFSRHTAWNPYEQAFPAVFAAFIAIAFFQPPPVRRYWWMFFAVSWAIAWSKRSVGV